MSEDDRKGNRKYRRQNLKIEVNERGTFLKTNGMKSSSLLTKNFKLNQQNLSLSYFGFFRD